MEKYLIEYEVNYNNGKEIGKDDIFSGDGVFYINAKNEKEAKRMALRDVIKVRFMNFHKFKFEITRVEECQR